MDLWTVQEKLLAYDPIFVCMEIFKSKTRYKRSLCQLACLKSTRSAGNSQEASHTISTQQAHCFAVLEIKAKGDLGGIPINKINYSINYNYPMNCQNE